MNLAAILGLYLLGLGYVAPSCLTPGAPQSTPQPPAAASSAQRSAPVQAAPALDGQTPRSTDQAKPSTTSPAKHRRRRKTTPSNCTNTAATNTTVGNSADSTNTGGSASTNATALPPCPPPRKVVRNGGSAEPSIQLVGGPPDEQSVHQRSTDQLTAATEDNLKKVAGRQLTPSQQEMVSQIKQFMAQSKTALAAGDSERGHNLAMKAQLLSDELVKP